MRHVQAIELASHPPALDVCVDVMREAGADALAIFGGAIRDADYAAYHHESRAINDYDVRIWLSEDDHEVRVQQFVANVSALTRAAVRVTPSAGTGRARYCFDFSGIEADVSIRPFSADAIANENPAIERAGDSDIGLCSVAIDAQKQAWATQEYLNDRNNRTLSVYPNPDTVRITAYVARMKQKFPDHEIVYL